MSRVFKFQIKNCWLQQKFLLQKTASNWFHVNIWSPLLVSSSCSGLFLLKFPFSFISALWLLFSFITAALNWKQSILNWLQDPLCRHPLKWKSIVQIETKCCVTGTCVIGKSKRKTTRKTTHRSKHTHKNWICPLREL